MSDELVERFGSPAHKHIEPDVEIWHYPLGIAGGTLYSIHVAVVPGDKPEPYMHMEPTIDPDTVPQRPWWRFW